MRTIHRLVLVLVATCTLLTQLSGCSYLFVQGPPPNHEQLPYFDCSTGNGWPIFDGVIAGLQAIRIGVDLDQPPNTMVASWSRNTDILIGTGLLALFGSAAWVGFHRVSECNDAHARMVQRIYQRGAPPPPPPPPAAGPPGSLPPSLPPPPQ